jgi:MFS transporter, ACS family, pantothenate transporter
MGLRNNVPTSLLRTTLNPWPGGTPDFVNHVVIKEYIQDTAKKAGVHDAIIYGARVTNIRKAGSRWGVSWSTLHQNVETGRIEEKEETKVRYCEYRDITKMVHRDVHRFSMQ